MLCVFRPTFYRVYKKKSTEGFQSIPYVVALFSAMLWLYYGMLKTDGYLLITSNSVGCAIEAAYITVYMVYATRSSKVALSLSLPPVLFYLLFSTVASVLGQSYHPRTNYQVTNISNLPVVIIGLEYE